MFAEHLHSSRITPGCSITKPRFGIANPSVIGSRIADPGSSVEVAAGLLDYLQRRLHISGLSFASAPTPYPNGWEAHNYTFRLQAGKLPPEWSRPLILRIHVSSRGLTRARHEFEVQRHLVRLGYPVPEAFLLEESCHLFGGPFLLMEQISGQIVLDAMLLRPWDPLHFPGLMAENQARLHDLLPDGFPIPPGQFLARQLDQLRTTIIQSNLTGLGPGLEWLQTHRPSEPATVSILHLDFHPLNLIERPDGSLAVIDWTYADCGDPHADVAATLVIQECIPVESASLWQQLCIFVGRPLVTSWYLHTYRRCRPLDEGRLAYYRAWAALRALARYAQCMCAGPEISDTKPSLVTHLVPDLLGSLCHYFLRWTGVDVRL